jgi:predicted DNA-binding transcriptional regulator AlpA
MDPLLTPKQVQKLLGASLPYIYKLASTNRILVVRIPSLGAGREKNLIRFKLEDVLNFINSHYSKED